MLRLFSDVVLDKPFYFRNHTVLCLLRKEGIDDEGCISDFLFAPQWRGIFCFKGSFFLHRITPFIVCKLIKTKEVYGRLLAQLHRNLTSAHADGCAAQCFEGVQRGSIFDPAHVSSPAGCHACFAVRCLSLAHYRDPVLRI